MTPEGVAALIVSIAALGGTIAAWLKAKGEKPKSDADAMASNAKTIAELSNSLTEAYRQIAELRANQEDVASRRDYEEYLLRGIARLTASLAANELSVPWIPLGYDEFIQREANKEATKRRTK